MKTNEVQEIIGKYGLIEYNGKFYPSSAHGFIRSHSTDKNKIILERLEGNPIEIQIKSINKFTVKQNPKL